MFRRQQSHLTLPSSLDYSAKLVRPAVRPAVIVIVVIFAVVVVVVVVVVVAYLHAIAPRKSPFMRTCSRAARKLHIVHAQPCRPGAGQGWRGGRVRPASPAWPAAACRIWTWAWCIFLAMHVSYVRAAKNGGEMAPKER